MVIFLISFLLAVALLAAAIYFWLKPPAPVRSDALLPPPQRGLFIDSTPAGQAETLARTEADSAAAAKAASRTQLLERAFRGDKSTLQEAQTTGDRTFYEEALDILLASADSDPKLLSLVSYVARHNLRTSKKLAERAIDSYKAAPDRNSTAKTLHIAALSDDATVYLDALETALSFWHAGSLPEVSAQELCAVLEGEFWVLSASTRSSGAGFLLKRALADARHKLEANSNH